jgi:hypothetical protein
MIDCSLRGDEHPKVKCAVARALLRIPPTAIHSFLATRPPTQAALVRDAIFCLPVTTCFGFVSYRSYVVFCFFSFQVVQTVADVLTSLLWVGEAGPANGSCGWATAGGYVYN